MYAQRAGSVSKGGNVVDEDRFTGLHLAGPERLLEHQRLRLTSSDGAGVNTDRLGKVLVERVRLFQIGDMDRVGVGKQPEAVMPREVCEECVRVDGSWIQRGIPGVYESFETESHAKALAKFL